MTAILFIFSLVFIFLLSVQKNASDYLGEVGMNTLAFLPILSTLLFLCYIFNIKVFVAPLLCFVVLWISFYLKEKPLSELNEPRSFFRISWTKTNFVLIGLSLISLYLFYRYTALGGAWDAQKVWNFKAQFLIHPETWQEMFLDKYAASHRDYPLFIPMIISFLSMTFYVSVEAAAIIFHTFIYVMLLGGTLLVLKRQKVNAILKVLIIASICLSRAFMAKSASQYADTTIACYLIWMYYWFLKKDTSENYFAAIVLLCSFIWIKNESSIIFLLLLYPVFRLGFDVKKRMVQFVSAGILIIIPQLIFKTYYAPTNKITKEIDFLNTIFEPERYLLIFEYLGYNLLYYFPMLVVVLLLAIFSISLNTNKKYVYLLVFPLFVFFIFCSVYLITPYPVEWHIKNSQDRLIHQLYPSLLVICAIIINQSMWFQKILLRLKSSRKVA